MAINKISKKFAKLSVPKLGQFAGALAYGLTDNPAFLLPTVTPTELIAGQTVLGTAATAAKLGGSAQTAVMNAAKLALIALIRKEANYVEGAADNNLAAMLSTGFLVNSNNRAQSQLLTPNLIEVDNGMTTQLIARAQGVSNARAFEVQVRIGMGAWVPAGIFAQSRNMILVGLIPGTIYSVQVRAIGGSTGYSDWCDPKSHMAM